MANQKRDPVQQQVLNVVLAVQDHAEPNVQEIRIFPQASGEIPYQIIIPGEVAPLAGLVLIPE